MIIGLPEILASALIWAGTEAHAWGKGHAQAQVSLIEQKEKYCPPVLTLPKDLPEWQQKLYKQQCSGMMDYLKDKLPERKLVEPAQSTPETISP